MNARLKTILLSAFGVMTVFTSVTYTSCNTDKCKAIVCAYGGVCSEGVCVCGSGYEGPQCEKVVRDKFLGVYTVLEKGTISLTTQYSVTVEKGPNTPDVIIKNFHNNFVNNVSAYVKADTIYIPQQTVDGKWSVQGFGKLEDDKYYGDHGKLVLRYAVRDVSLPLSVPPDDYGLNEGDPSIWNK